MGGEVEKFLGAAEGMGENVLSTATGGYSKKKRVEAGQAAERAKVAARERIKPIPDPDAGKTQRRKTAARKRAGRGGRTSSILSDTQDTLG